MNARRQMVLLAAGVLGLATLPAVARPKEASATRDQAADPSPAPDAGLRPAGQGLLRFMGFDVYRARLWVGQGFRSHEYAAHPLALELEYFRAFTAQAIARRSIEEMRRVGTFEDADAQRWRETLQTALTDVKPGDRLVGVYRPGVGVQFRLNGRGLGELADPEFARLFFGIWLSPATSQPALRRSLLAATDAT